MSLRFWLNIGTVILLALVVFFGWDQITQAWGLLGNVNWWILLLLIPVQFASYFASGEIAFSYLRAKGDLKNMSRLKMARIALELNFVNHIAIIPMAAGSSYFSWLLHHHGVKVGRSTMSQIVRGTLVLATFIIMLILSIIILSFDYKIGKPVLTFISILLGLAIFGIAFLIYIISSKKRSLWLSGWLSKFINKIGHICSRGKKCHILEPDKISSFFVELHHDYVEIMNDKKILVAPFWWSVSFMILDTLLILISFWALGFWVNPAAIFIAFGLATIGSMLAVTPGGAGVYEAVMVTFLASAGLAANIAIAGTLLARVMLLAGTIVLGYAFYQLTVNKYGKINKSGL